GEEIDAFDLVDGPAFINDVTVTRDAAYFTNSQAAELYRLPLGPDGVPTGDVQTLPLTGEWQQVTGFNANGIAATPDGGTLLVVNSSTGTLYNVDPATGEAVAVDTGGTLLTRGDGILLRGKTLYIVRNQANEVVELRMSPNFLSATFVDAVTDPNFDVPTTLATQGSRLYAVNARFGTPSTPETEYDIVLVDGQ
ncbi:MAG: superoxide dismutase, partial [Actinomycetota bacterium]|nr:superoxide dismutase [Actinomycetota bacterium]